MTIIIIITTLLFLIILALIFTEQLERTIAAAIGASLVLILGTYLGFFSEEEAIAAIDFETIGLLLGMMILVALLEPTGFFQFMAVWAGRISRGKPVLLMIMLGVVTTVISMFLDNVTTVVLIAPVTVLISEILGISSIPLLMAEALLSNTGGVATLVGDPPNVLIASAAGLTFTDFLTHSLPVVLVVWLVALVLIRFLFRKELAVEPRNRDAIFQLDPKESLDDWKTARKVLIILAGAIVLFFLQNITGLSPAMVALSAAAVALVWVRPKIDDTLRHVEWSVLLFFIALFIMVGALEAVGLFEWMVDQVSHLTDIHPALFGVLLLWITAILSMLIDNIPVTIALIPVILGLAEKGINPYPLWWALAFGAGFGGNGTIIGSSANIIVANLSNRTRTPITGPLWIKKGLPVMIVTCSVASILYVVFFPFFSS
jgi:Na+/H+ antiporter NhaD/arsenite permease-like protein